MQRNERIRLDAVLLDVIDHSVFSAELGNGHRFVAVAKGRSGDALPGYAPKDEVVVEFSPYDMSTARVITGNRAESSDL